MEILCPICQSTLTQKEKSYYCEHNHCFDIAKEGYINLLRGNSQTSGDSKESIQARTAFLSKDYYRFLKDEMINVILKYKIQNVVDLACGEGYYTKDLPLQDKIGVDLSKSGLKKASKSDKSTTYILASIFNTPLQSASFDMVMTCFAPVAEKEIERLLKEEGIFLLVSPGKDHLLELKEAVYQEAYKNEEEVKELEGLKRIEAYNISKKVTLANEDFSNLFKMTPYFYKTSPDDKKKLESIETLDITFDFYLQIYRKEKGI